MLLTDTATVYSTVKVLFAREQSFECQISDHCALKYYLSSSNIYVRVVAVSQSNSLHATCFGPCTDSHLPIYCPLTFVYSLSN